MLYTGALSSSLCILLLLDNFRLCGIQNPIARTFVNFFQRLSAYQSIADHHFARRTPPSGVKWTHIDCLPPLSPESAKELFLDMGEYRAIIRLDDLVEGARTISLLHPFNCTGLFRLFLAAHADTVAWQEDGFAANSWKAQTNWRTLKFLFQYLSHARRQDVLVATGSSKLLVFCVCYWTVY